MSSAAPLVLMMAGGTGGHVYPALAVASELRSRGCRVEWVGTARGLEARVVPAAGIKLHTLSVRGVRGKNSLWKLFALVSLFFAALQALWLVFRLSPRCVVGLGGYAAGPAGIAAWLLRKPLLIHEQNAVAGTTNKMLAPFASKVLAGFSSAFSDNTNSERVGNPVRHELVQKGAQTSFTYAGQRPLHLLVLGGSLGAKPINDILPEVMQQLFEDDRGAAIEVRHQCGDAHEVAVKQAYAAVDKEQVQVSAFIEDMAEAYAWSDLVLCRAGALTVSELAIMGRPSILIPLPHAIDDHQTFNARFLSDSGAAILLHQAKMTRTVLVDVLLGYLASPGQLAIMAAAASAAAIPEATDLVCDSCEELIYGR
ncbi:MAG: UDP-N-acetylglucosamine--N-acetylmuramyl-(pentapeptide) pyrophosphoryl-undecaprenol N-acetylglucosamine transferase [Halioglobus sp.]|jgi:UDP-N-acetylglucosamine--N-acetylmuramyl-(pentapeptide) pyrophosphoryl-undecaprenol N-acetylglucosamine transferase